MIKQEFNIGDAVYTLHADDEKIFYMKYGLVVGVDTRLDIRFHGAHLSTDLAENITGYIYSCVRIHKNENGTFSLDTDEGVEPVPQKFVFDSKEEMKSYLLALSDNLWVEIKPDVPGISIIE